MTACILWSIFKNNQYKWIGIFIISAIISILSKWEFLRGCLGDGFFNSLYEYAHYSFRIYNLFFFILGIYLRYKYEHEGFLYSTEKMKVIRVCSIITIICIAVLFFFDYANYEKIMFFVMNSNLLVVVIFDCVNQKIPKSEIIEFLGRYSLPIYLYHIMCKLLAQYICANGTPGYYIISLLSLIIGCFLIFFLRRIDVVNTILLGSTTSSLNSE